MEHVIHFFEHTIIFYFAAINLTYLAFMLLAAKDLRSYQRWTGNRDPSDEANAAYRPISILVPAHNERDTIIASVRGLLLLGYPEYEIIVINDGSTDDTLAELQRAYKLFPVPTATRAQLPSALVRGQYRSIEYPNLIVLDKAQGGKSDALNAGLNVSAYPLVCSIDADSLLEPDALRRLVGGFVEDDRVIAAGGIVRVMNGAIVERGQVVEARAPGKLIVLCQIQEYVRGFLTGRAPLARLNSLLIISGAFGLFRKDALVRAGGYHRGTVCEDMEIIVRLHRLAREAKRQVKVLFVPDPVCWTQVPTDWRSLLRQRSRWQRGLLESLWMHRRMMMNPRYGAIGLLAMPFYVFFEALGPVVEIGGYVFVFVLYLMGMLNTHFAVLFFVLAVLFGILLSIGALNLDDLLFRRYARARDLAKMMLGAVLEYCGYRQLLALTRVTAFFTVLGERGKWGSMRRSEIPEQMKRSAAA